MTMVLLSMSIMAVTNSHTRTPIIVLTMSAIKSPHQISMSGTGFLITPRPKFFFLVLAGPIVKGKGMPGMAMPGTLGMLGITSIGTGTVCVAVLVTTGSGMSMAWICLWVVLWLVDLSIGVVCAFKNLSIFGVMALTVTAA